jgi:uncharacterized protein (TIRG00374 family)
VSRSRRALRLAATLALSALCVWYIVAKIDLRRTGRVLGDADPWLLVLALAILVGALVPLAWRWQKLLAARGIDDSLPWLLRAYFVSYTAGQILPTSLGGDAMRIFETARRHPGAGGPVAGSVVLERLLGAGSTLALGLVGFALALGRYDVGAYVWLELLIAVGTAALAVVAFARRARAPLKRVEPLLARLKLDRPLGALYRGLHGYRDHARLVWTLLALTVAVQALRVLTIWLAGRAVGVHLSPLPYFVMGPLFFLVMLAPFTVNGLALREAFFVSFLGQLGVDADRAFATGFLYFLLTVALSLPGAALWAWESLYRTLNVQARAAAESPARAAATTTWRPDESDEAGAP